MDGKTQEIKYAVKDSVFTLLFSDIKNIRKLYQSLHDDSDNYSDEDFKIITLENVFINAPYNDLGFTVKNKVIILAEAQSTFNPNMGLRLLIYIAQSYHDYISEHKFNIFSEKLIRLPNPEFIVIYSGSKKTDITEIRLSDCFEPGTTPNIELVVKVIGGNNVKEGIIQEYLKFCEMYDEKVRSVKPSKEKAYSLKKVIKDCIDNGILKDFLTLHQKEVEDMMMTVIPPEQALEYIKLEEYNKGIEQGIAQGKLDTSLNFARNMLKNNYSIDSIIEITGLSREQIERLLPSQS